MSEIILGSRKGGKTLELIKRSAKDGRYILVSNRRRAEKISEFARELGLYIPFPVTVEEYYKGDKFRGSSLERNGIYIDDADDIIRQIFGTVEIKAMTMTYEKIIYLKPEQPPTVANPDTPTETDFKYFTAEQVRNMSQKEVKENYSDIMKSMKKW